MLRLSFETGTEPGKWFARYRDSTAHGLRELPHDDPLSVVIEGEADVALMRLPDLRVGPAGERFHQVRLYTEARGVAVPKDSVYAEVGEPVRSSELIDEHVNHTYPHGTTDDLRAALQVVAANVGIAYAPVPLLKALSKKQVRVLELIVDEDGGPHEATEIALVWPVAADSDAVQDFVGVAKGRTKNTSRASESDDRPARGSHGAATGKTRNYKLKSESRGRRKGKGGNHPKRGVGRKRT